MIGSNLAKVKFKSNYLTIKKYINEFRFEPIQELY